MLSINMRIFKTVLLIGAFGASVRCLPVADELLGSTTEVTSVTPQEIAATTAESTPGHFDPATDYYDQRQNGSENWRIHVDGVVLVFAPVETLLLAGLAGSNLSIPDGGSTIPSFGDLDKPSIDVINKTEPAISKTYSMNKPALRLANFFAPFIRRLRHEQETSVH
ncbi:uncharacterized protein [Linepithema humile]|uniref:uncharacterized protein n=1 Tax=Linepithema humile TaxID=83485 RepID=UPI00062345F6|nr:PREDICTED: uncharacterized protein LOC105678815 [Linepithema humile]